MSTTFCLPTEIIVNIKMLYAKEDKIGKNKMITVLSNSTQVLKYYNRFSRSMLNKCSDRSMEVKPPAIEGNYDKQTNRPTDGKKG